jgi:hypothetical protein
LRATPRGAEILLELGRRKVVLIDEAVQTLALRSVVLISASIALSACSLIAHYDQVAYEHATSAKVDTLALMDKATGSYDDHQKEIEALVLELNKAYEYDRGRALNKLTVAQWDILRDPNRNLVGGFLKLWKTKGSLGATFIAEKKQQVSDAFDQIIALESGKSKPAKASE